MFHTLVITQNIIRDEVYNQIYKSLELISKNNNTVLYGDEKKGYITHALKDIGFSQITLKKFFIDRKYKYPVKMIEIQLNPTKLLDKDIIELTHEEDLQELEQKFNDVVAGIHLDLNTFMYWTLRRIDYSINIKTEHVEEYIQLFQRGDIPYRFKMMYDKKSKRRKHKKGSMYLKSNSATINFYNKFDERLNHTGEEVENARNILRLEVQCSKGKTDALKRKYEFDMKYLYYFLSKEISDYVIHYYYDKTVGAGNYYKLDKAIKIVEESSLRASTKQKLIELLKDINAKRSLYEVKSAFKDRKDRESFNRHIKQLRELGINPVTIPQRWNIDCLENLVYKIQ